MKDKQRETKFRAWDIRKSMFIPSDVWAIINQPDGRERAIMLSDWEDYIVGEYFYPENQVIMQYTGLKDKNGTEIYEGDLLNWTEWEEEGTDEPDIYIVSYVAPSFVWNCYRNGRRLDGWDEPLENIDYFVVVGNIYENPDLLDPQPDEKGEL